MSLNPRVSLQTIFLLFFCAAVGLATHSDPYSGTEAAIATAIAIGLFQQLRQLIGWYPSDSDFSNEVAFARWFAVIWRLLVIGIITTWVTTNMLVRAGKLQLPDHEKIWFFMEYQAVLPICIVLVLCNSLSRWRSAKAYCGKRRGYAAGIWAVGIVIGLVAITESTMIEFLTHETFAGIEAAQPASLHRPDVYPDLAGERYRSLWLAFAATASLLAASAIVVWSSNKHDTRRMILLKYWLFASLVAPPVVFSHWYYTTEFHRLSPEMAGAGLAAIWMDWLNGALLALGLVTMGAYWLSRTSWQRAEITADLSQDVERTAFHESFLCLAIIAVNATATLGLYTASFVSARSIFGRPVPAWAYLTWLCSPLSLLALALLIVVVQFCRVRWQCRSRTVAWEMVGLSRVNFLRNWVAMTLLLIVGVPTLKAFAFLLFLGPWNLLRVFGF